MKSSAFILDLKIVHLHTQALIYVCIYCSRVMSHINMSDRIDWLIPPSTKAYTRTYARFVPLPNLTIVQRPEKLTSSEKEKAWLLVLSRLLAPATSTIIYIYCIIQPSKQLNRFCVQSSGGMPKQLSCTQLSTELACSYTVYM